MLLEHVSSAADASDATLSVVSDVDTFVSVEWNALSSLNDLDLDSWDVSAGSVDHPSINGVSVNSVFVLMCLISSDKKRLVFSEEINLLNSSSDLLSLSQEESIRSSLKDSSSELILPLFIKRIQNVAELIVAENGDVDKRDIFLIDVNNVNVRLSGGNQPLLTSLSLLSIDICEGLDGLKHECVSVIDDESFDGLNNLLVNAWNVEPLGPDDPFLSSLSFIFKVVLGLTTSSHLQTLV